MSFIGYMLPADIIRLIAMQLSHHRDILRLCRTNKTIHDAIWDSKSFWEDVAYRFLTKTPQRIPYQTLRADFLYIRKNHPQNPIVHITGSRGYELMVPGMNGTYNSPVTMRGFCQFALRNGHRHLVPDSYLSDADLFPHAAAGGYLDLIQSMLPRVAFHSTLCDAACEAIQHGHEEMIEVLLNELPLESYAGHPCQEAVKVGNIRVVERLLPFIEWSFLPNLITTLTLEHENVIGKRILSMILSHHPGQLRWAFHKALEHSCLEYAQFLFDNYTETVRVYTLYDIICDIHDVPVVEWLHKNGFLNATMVDTILWKWSTKSHRHLWLNAMTALLPLTSPGFLHNLCERAAYTTELEVLVIMKPYMTEENVKLAKRIAVYNDKVEEVAALFP